MRAARTPPDPPPMTNRSTSYSAISAPIENSSFDKTEALILVLTRFLHANRIHFARKRYSFDKAEALILVLTGFLHANRIHFARTRYSFDKTEALVLVL